MSQPDTDLIKKRIGTLRYRVSRYLDAQLVRLYAPLCKRHSLPDFLIVGAMKCGTTSLFNYLIDHPGVIPPRKKEVHYFHSPRNRKYGDNWYRAHFPSQSAIRKLSRQLGYRAITGEATPAMVSNLYALSAGALLPDAKLIMILRNPTDRAYSHYQHQRRRFLNENLPFWEALQAEDARIAHDIDLNNTEPDKVSSAIKRFSYKHRGKYIDQIHRWLSYYPREQLLILNYQDLKVAPDQLFEQVCRFLELPDHKFNTDQRFNVGGYKDPMDDRCKQYLDDYFRPYNRRLFDFLGEDWGWPV